MNIMLNAIIPVVLRNSGTTTPSLTIQTVLGWGSEVVSFIITTMNSFLSWMIQNPIVLISLIMVLIVSSVGFLRHLLGA